VADRGGVEDVRVGRDLRVPDGGVSDRLIKRYPDVMQNGLEPLRSGFGRPFPSSLSAPLVPGEHHIDAGAEDLQRGCQDWLTGGLPGRDPETVATNRSVLEPVLAVIGSIRLRDLDVTDVDRALAAMAVSRSSATVAKAHQALTRAITRAQAKNLVLRNVSALTGMQGRPSRSMTLAQASALTAAAKAAGPRTCAYILLSLGTGCGPRKHGRCGGSTSTSATPPACRLARPAWRCGGRCGLRDLPRPASHGGPSRCPIWR